MIDRMLGSLVLALFALFLPATASAEAGPDVCPPSSLAEVPSRPIDASSGSDFARRIWALSADEREETIEAELLAGNMPRFLRRLVPVTLVGERRQGSSARVTVCVLPDYLAVGSDRDFLYVPMRLSTALTVARRFGFTLPTTKMVDAIYAQSAAHLFPQPLPASDAMRSTAYYQHHTMLIDQQRDALGDIAGLLIAGHKKDLVITGRLWRTPDRVAIYGWHRSAHDPIQPLSTVHGARYADYSHGVRLVSNRVYMDGVAKSMTQVLADPQLGEIFTHHGPIERPAELAAMLSKPVAGDAIPAMPKLSSLGKSVDAR